MTNKKNTNRVVENNDAALTFNNLLDKMIQSSKRLLSKEEFYKWLDGNIKIKDYISIQEKMAIINLQSIIFPIQCNYGITELNQIAIDDIDLCHIEEVYELIKIFELMCSYICDAVVEDKHKTFSTYNEIFKSGFYDYIMDKVEKDYLRFVNMCDDVLGIKNMYMNTQLIKLLRSIPDKEELEKIQNTFNQPENIEIMDKLNYFIGLNNPNLKCLFDSISEMAKEEKVNKQKTELKSNSETAKKESDSNLRLL